MLLLLAAAPSAHAAPGDLDPNVLAQRQGVVRLRGRRRRSVGGGGPAGREDRRGWLCLPAGRRPHLWRGPLRLGARDPSFRRRHRRHRLENSTTWSNSQSSPTATSWSRAPSATPRTGFELRPSPRYSPNDGLDPLVHDNDTVQRPRLRQHRQRRRCLRSSSPNGRLIVARRVLGQFRPHRYDTIISTQLLQQQHRDHRLRGHRRTLRMPISPCKATAGSSPPVLVERQNFKTASVFALAGWQFERRAELSAFFSNDILITTSATQFGTRGRMQSRSRQEARRSSSVGSSSDSRFSDLQLFSDLASSTEYNQAARGFRAFDAEGANSTLRGGGRLQSRRTGDPHGGRGPGQQVRGLRSPVALRQRP